MRLQRPAPDADPFAAQREYYRATAEAYDSVHTSECDEHYLALRHVVGYLRWTGARSLLDTGCGTGRAIRYLTREMPELDLYGNDPSPDLLRIATEQHGIDPVKLECIGSEHLPYPNRHFDAVLETGVLHHVPNPEIIVSEMLRVSRQAIFISDNNIYGQGSLAAGVTKLTLARLGLLRSFNRLRRRGKEWYYDDDDGVAWSYSAFDSLPLIQAACAEVIAIPTESTAGALAASPLLQSSTVLIAGFKEPLPSRPCRLELPST